MSCCKTGRGGCYPFFPIVKEAKEGRKLMARLMQEET